MGFIDVALVPGLLAGAVIAAQVLLRSDLPSLLITGLVVGAVAAAVAVIERIRPERPEHRPFDQPLHVEILHFVFNYNLGYVLAFAVLGGIGAGLAAVTSVSLWPSGWPLAAQVLLAAVLAEGSSYWQHRLFHRVAWLWPFHALHHSGPRLNLVRAGRFHFVDIGPGAFMTFLPLVLLRTPDRVLTVVATIAGALGVIQHSNMRVRTPAWLDRLICTPAVHRCHHSIDRRECDANYGTLVMVFDRLFGTYVAPRAPTPDAIGIEPEVRPAGFLRQMLAPFRRMKWVG